MSLPHYIPTKRAAIAVSEDCIEWPLFLLGVTLTIVIQLFFTTDVTAYTNRNKERERSEMCFATGT